MQNIMKIDEKSKKSKILNYIVKYILMLLFIMRLGVGGLWGMSFGLGVCDLGLEGVILGF